MPWIWIVDGTDTSYDQTGIVMEAKDRFRIDGEWKQVWVEDDDSLADGDNTTPQIPDDGSQTIDLGDGPRALVYDYSFTVKFRGTDYEFAMIDVDIDGNGVIEGEGESVKMLALIGPDFPPPNPGGGPGPSFRILNPIADTGPRPWSDFICFAAGSRILTEKGWRPVEKVRPGMRLLTKDNGWQEVAWAGRKTVAGLGRNTPIRIAKGALGNRRDLLVSPQHRMLLTGWQAELNFGTEEVLIGACHLVNGTTIRHAPCASVDYVHLLLENHEIVFAEGGCETESLHPARVLAGHMGSDSRDEVLRIFPELADLPQRYGPTARPALKRFEGRLVA